MKKKIEKVCKNCRWFQKATNIEYENMYGIGFCYLNLQKIKKGTTDFCSHWRKR